ncbi:hypothetical protein [Homoserinimonas sp. OAct 916]|uniref:hypothetical protein n=1 Tax=Homoserinimonas sp. OAct 916 TaxID=2211450 RepID=UPI000DBE69A3|nr:hypothetical protein [Homoserinimonas sp. OAct 916]
MAHNTQGEPEQRPAHTKQRFVGFFEKLDNAMRPIFGPPATPLDYDVADGIPANVNCPVCGHGMIMHTVNRDEANHILYCPAHADEPLEADDRRLNDLGMIKAPRPD